MTDCEGVSNYMEYPAALIDAKRNPAWPPPSPGVTVAVELFMLDCKRVSWGSFERPMRLVIDANDHGNAPDSCRADESNGAILRKIISSLWVNDAEFADYLRSTYDGLTVHYSDIQVTPGTMHGLETYEWKWGLGQDNQTTLTTVNEPDRQADQSYPLRFYFYNETRVGAMDFELLKVNIPILIERLTYGKVYAPMLAAGLSEDYAVRGAHFDSSSVSGVVTLYQDHRCKPLDA